MSKSIQTNGTYTSKKSNKEVSYSFEYEQFDNLQDAIATLGGEAEVLKAVQRMVKVDANNTAREKAKSANGDSTRVLQTEEQKAEAKIKRQADKAILAKLKEKGIGSLDELDSLLG